MEEFGPILFQLGDRMGENGPTMPDYVGIWAPPSLTACVGELGPTILPGFAVL